MEKSTDIKTIIEKINRVPTPRPIRMKKLGFVVFIFIVIGVSVFLGLADWASQYGTSTQAKITNIRIIGGRTHGTAYDLEFLDDGMKVTTPGWADINAYYSMHEGDLVSIHYLPIFPWFAYEDKKNHDRFDWFLFLPFFLLFFTSIAALGILRVKKLLKTGKATRGIVAYGKGTSSLYTNRNTTYTYIVNFEFGSDSYQSKIISRNPSLMRDEECIVLFDPNNPKFNQAYKVDTLFTWWKLSED